MESSQTLNLLLTALTVSVPTFGWVVLGVALRRVGVLSEAVITGTSRFAFVAALPVLLFSSAAGVDYTALDNSSYLAVGVLSTLATLVLSACYGRWRGFALQPLGVFVQAAFRSNLAIVGIALCISAYGERGLALAALPVAMLTALYNILAVWVLNSTHGGSRSIAGLLLGMAKNPLLVGIVAGVLASLLQIPAATAMAPVSGFISTYFIPLTLICIGGSMKMNRLRSAGPLTWEATAWRLCVAPMFTVALALLLGVRGEQLGVLFLLLASPVAAASFVMVVAARGDGTLAANIIVVTTLLSMLTVTLGFFVLSWLGLVGQLV